MFEQVIDRAASGGSPRSFARGVTMRFEVGNTRGGEPSRWLYAGNGEMVAWAGETFASTSNATRAAEAFTVGAKTARYDVYEDSGDKWRWRAWRSSDKVASSGESFSSKYSAERAANNVRDNAGTATGT
jgi:uncharacterized protein